jgi:hypothetical protein
MKLRAKPHDTNKSNNNKDKMIAAVEAPGFARSAWP